MNCGALRGEGYNASSYFLRRRHKFHGAKWKGITNTARDNTVLSWQTIQFDTDGFLSLLVPTLIIVPRNRVYKYAYVSTSELHGGGSTTVSHRQIRQYRNGVNIRSVAVHEDAMGTNGNYIGDIFSIQPGDSFDAYVDEDDAAVINMEGLFCIEILE